MISALLKQFRSVASEIALRATRRRLEQALYDQFLFCLPHGLERLNGDFKHGPVGFAGRQGLQGKIWLNEEAHDGRIQMVGCPADVFHSNPCQERNQEDAAGESPKN